MSSSMLHFRKRQLLQYEAEIHSKELAANERTTRSKYMSLLSSFESGTITRAIAYNVSAMKPKPIRYTPFNQVTSTNLTHNKNDELDLLIKQEAEEDTSPLKRRIRPIRFEKIHLPEEKILAQIKQSEICVKSTEDKSTRPTSQAPTTVEPIPSLSSFIQLNEEEKSKRSKRRDKKLAYKPTALSQPITIALKEMPDKPSPKEYPYASPDHKDQIVIGPYGTLMTKAAWSAINWSLYSSVITKIILASIFDHETLATHSVIFSSKDIQKLKKKPLDPAKVADIIHIVTSRINITSNEVYNTIQSKCNLECYVKRNRINKYLASND